MRSQSVKFGTVTRVHALLDRNYDDRVRPSMYPGLCMVNSANVRNPLISGRPAGGHRLGGHIPK